MNRGLLEKSLRESFAITAGFGLALLAMEILLAYILPTFQQEIQSSILQLEFVRKLLAALLGSEFGAALGPQLLDSVPWVHPVVLAVVLAHEITYCTRVPAAEIDRATADVLLALPVSRLQVYLCESAVWLVSGIVLLAMGLAGNVLGRWIAGSSLAITGRVLIVLVNLLAVYLSVGGFAFLVSTLSNRRGRAVGAVFAVVLVSFLLNFIAQFWKPAADLSFLSFLDYYRPLFVLRGDGWPVGDLVALTVAAGAFWSAGAWVFGRRDVCTI